MPETQQYNRLMPQDQQSQGGQQGQVSVAPTPTATNPRERHSNKLYAFGITECVLGNITFILGVVTIIVAEEYPYGYDMVGPLFSFTAQGIWGGMFLLTLGILGICARKYPTVCVYNANMAVSIVTSVVQAAGIILSGFAIPFSMTTNLFIHIVILLIQFASMIICIIHSAFCCAGVCYDRKTRVSVAQVPQQYVQLPNGQYAIVSGYPSATAINTPSAQGYPTVIHNYQPNASRYPLVGAGYPSTQAQAQNIGFVTAQQPVPQSSNCPASQQQVAAVPPPYAQAPDTFSNPATYPDPSKQ